MAGYREELEKLRFTPGEKEALVHRLAAGTGERKKRSMRLPYRALIAAVAAACLLIGAVGAASLAGISPAFRALFGITSETQRERLGAEQVNLRFEDLNGSGAAIVIKEVVADQEQLYAVAEFIPPEGADLSPMDDGYPVLEGDWTDTGVVCQFYTDEKCTDLAMERGFFAGYTSYRTEGLEFVLCVNAFDDLPEDGTYCWIDGISRLTVWQGAERVSVLEGMDFELVLPVISTASYDFRGRDVIWLGDSAFVVVDDLTLSPISVTFDLLIMDGDAYNEAEKTYGPWEAWVVLADGARVEAEFRRVATISRGLSRGENDAEYGYWFRADHIRLSLSCPIDVSQIKDIVLEPGSGFHFNPEYFANDTYWSQVNTTWKES